MHSVYLNVEKGEVFIVADWAFAKAEDLLFEKEDEEESSGISVEDVEEEIVYALDILENDDKYFELPDRFEINEYSMMEDFCDTVSDENKAQNLFNALRGKGAFRRFKDMVIALDVEDDWYAYKTQRYRQLAIRWCEGNGILYEE